MANMLSDTLKAFVDRTITAVENRTFVSDPVLGPELSSLHSQLGSLVKRDGHVLQHAIYEALATSQFLTVVHLPDFPVTAEADRLAEQASYEVCLNTNLPLSRNVVRTIDLDMMVIDHRTGEATGYEVKRGNGKLDSGKQRQTIRDTLCVGMLVKAYAEAQGYRLQNGSARVIFVHGANTLPSEISLTGNDLDLHFGLPVQAAVAAATDYYRRCVAELVVPRLMGHARLAA